MESEEGAGELGGSLFEGMILFTSSDLSQSPPDEPSPAAVAPEVETAADPPSSSLVPSNSKALDEDLFSDLTLLTETRPLEPPPAAAAAGASNVGAAPPQPTLLSRQISRKKKRAVRIGYARDAAGSAPEDPDPTPSSSPAPLPPRRSEYPLSPPEAEDATVVMSSPDEPPPPTRLGTDYSSHPDPISAQSSPPPARREEERADDESSSAVVLEEEKNEDCAVQPEVPATVGTSEREDAFGSMEDKLELVKASISEKLEKVRKTAVSVSAERKELGRRRRKIAEDVSMASDRYKELETELEEACEAEDFEGAERVSEILAAVESEKDCLLTALRDAELGCDSVDSKMQEVLELQIAAEEKGVALLEQFAKDAANCADTVLKNMEEISVKEVEGWQSSMEFLEIRRLEMDIESHLILEARSGLEHSMELLVEDDRKEEEKLRRKQDVLAKELDELLVLVRLKEAEIAENDSKILEVEKKISGVFSESHETRSCIDRKNDNLQMALSNIESEGAALLIKRKEIDEFISVAEQKRSKLNELASVSLDEARTWQDLVGLRRRLASSILKSREDKVRLAKIEEKILEDIQILRQQISAARTTLQELSSTRASIQQEMTSVKQRIGFIDKRGPELEVEKKAAAAARNFKEAGRIAAEAKALNLEKESLQSKKETAVSQLQKLEEEIRDALCKIHENERMIVSKEEEAAMAGCKRLRLVAAAARAERSAALEMDDIEEGDVLLEQAEAAESKAREIQESYDLELEEQAKTFEHLVSIVSITNLAGQHLAEMASSFNIPSAEGSQL